MNPPLMLLALLLCCYSSVTAQRKESNIPSPDSPCGNPAEHSDFYFTPDEYEKATVTKVESGDTVVVTLGNGERRRVKLGGVDAPDMETEAGRLSRRYLSGLVLNKRVEVFLYGNDFGDKVVGGRISLAGAPSDVNLSMLQAGMGRYGSVEHVGSYEKCVYRITAERAKRGKKGLWKEHF